MQFGTTEEDIYGNRNKLYFPLPREQDVRHVWLLHWSAVLCSQEPGNSPRVVGTLRVVKWVIPEVVL